MKGFNLRRDKTWFTCYGSLALFLTAPVMAEEVSFDTEILQGRGISKNLAEYFADSPKYLPGRHSIKVTVNGIEKGTFAVLFGEKGQLCVDDDFTEAAGLRSLSVSSKEKCHELIKDYPTATINALPNKEALDLFLPTEALESQAIASQSFNHGGAAGLFNYELFSTRNETSGSTSSNYTQATLEGGLNAADWTLRSRHIVTDNDGVRDVDSLYTYAEHVFQAQKMRVQAGQITANSSLFSGGSISGVQFMPEQSLKQELSGVSVSGIARTWQARVEIQQSGRLIQASLVNAGPFTLENVPVLQSNKDLDVTVFETDGTSTHFIVPAASVRMNRVSSPTGLTFSLGKVRDSGNDYTNPWVSNISDGWLIAPTLAGQASGVLSEKYQATGAAVTWYATDNWQLTPSLLFSQDSFDNSRHGLKADLQSSLLLPERISLGMDVAHFDSDYRELNEALDKDFDGNQNSFSGNISWSHDVAGSFSLGYTYTQAAGDAEDTRYLLASWSKYYRFASVTVNWQHAVNVQDNDDDNNRETSGYQDDDMVYVNVSIPFGEQSVSLYTRNQGNRTNYGAQNNGAISNNTHYSISAERDSQSGDNSFNGNIATNLHYTQLNVGAGTSGSNQRSYNAILSGGIAAHKHGITFSPYPVKETFGIARLSAPESGVEISTPQGPIWTDRWGQAVIPSLNAWGKSRIEVNANALPQSIDLANGIKNISAGYGSFSEVNFKIMNTRRVMLSVKNADGTWLPKGTTIVDDKDNYQVSVVDDGKVFIANATDSPALYAIDDDTQKRCRIDYTLADEPPKESFYEQAVGVCK